MAGNNKWAEVSDNFLVEAICGEDVHDRKQALIEFDNRYRPMLLRYCKSKSSSDADAEDAVQDTLMAFLGKAKVGSIKEIKNVKAYLFRTARNKCVDVYRKNYAERDFEDNQTAEEDQASPEISESEFYKNPEAVAIQRELELIYEALTPEAKQLYRYNFLTKQLTGCPRTISILVGHLGLKYDPVARLLGKSRHAVEQCFYRASQIDRAYKYSEQAELDLNKLLLIQESTGKLPATAGHHLERTMQPVTSHLTEDEFKHIGLTPKDLKHYVTSIIVPIPGSNNYLKQLNSDYNNYLKELNDIANSRANEFRNSFATALDQFTQAGLRQKQFVEQEGYRLMKTLKDLSKQLREDGEVTDLTLEGFKHYLTQAALYYSNFINYSEDLESAAINLDKILDNIENGLDNERRNATTRNDPFKTKMDYILRTLKSMDTTPDMSFYKRLIIESEIAPILSPPNTNKDLFLLLTRKKDWDVIRRDEPEMGSDLLEFLFKVNIDGEHIVLEPQAPVKFPPIGPVVNSETFLLTEFLLDTSERYMLTKPVVNPETGLLTGFLTDLTLSGTIRDIEKTGQNKRQLLHSSHWNKKFTPTLPYTPSSLVLTNRKPNEMHKSIESEGADKLLKYWMSGLLAEGVFIA